MDFLDVSGNYKKNVLVAVTDSASAMILARQILNYREGHEKMITINCIVHALHSLCLRIFDEYKTFGKFMMDIKALFLNSPKRRREFRAKYPFLNLPPEPVKTRWGTWLKAAVYYSEERLIGALWSFSNLKSLTFIAFININSFAQSFRCFEGCTDSNSSC